MNDSQKCVANQLNIHEMEPLMISTLLDWHYHDIENLIAALAVL